MRFHFLIIGTVFVTSIYHILIFLKNCQATRHREVDNMREGNSMKIDSQYSQGLDWEALLHFVPNKSNTNCLLLFTTSTSVNRTNSPEYIKYIEYKQTLYAELDNLDKKGVKPAHGAPSHQKLTLLYQELAKPPFVKTVCEIGFNIGDSALAWLTAKPNVVLHSFDIGTKPKTPYIAVLLKKWFGDRFYFHAGNSLISVPIWTAAMGKICDVLSIDGDHSYEFVFADLLNMRDVARNPNILVS